MRISENDQFAKSVCPLNSRLKNSVTCETSTPRGDATGTDNGSELKAPVEHDEISFAADTSGV